MSASVVPGVVWGVFLWRSRFFLGVVLARAGGCGVAASLAAGVFFLRRRVDVETRDKGRKRSKGPKRRETTRSETERGVRHNVPVSRLYKDGDTWKDSHSFGRDDLPVVKALCDQAWTWIYSEGAVRTEAAA